MAIYLVTGGCGFIGSHVCDALLERGDSVRVLDDLSTGHVENLPEGVELTIGDVANGELVKQLMRGVDGCFHLAAVASVERSVEAWCETHRINLGGTINVLDAARDAQSGRPARVVYASSAAIYGDNASMPLAETSQPRPLSPYGADKLGSELHARIASLIHGVPTTGFRFFNVYGPRQDPSSPYSGVISIFVDRLQRGVPLRIHGDGQQARDFIYVADVVRFLLAGMDNAQGASVYNACTGSATTIVQLAQTLAALQGVPCVTESLPQRTGDIQTSLGDPRKARRQLSCEAEWRLSNGLRETLSRMDDRCVAA
jgi:UDP-glucose 4-epimerase